MGRAAIACLVLGLTAVSSVFAQAPASIVLSPDAEASVRKGLLAANAQDYALAVRYFQDARTIAGDAPELLYNIGLAESKIPGRELRALCWFAAYLVAAPGAANAGAVRQQIDALDVQSQSTLSRLIKSVQDAGGKLPDAAARSRALARVVSLWLLEGDPAQAIALAASVDPTSQQRIGNDLRESPFPAGTKTMGIADWTDRLSDDPVFVDLPGYLKSQVAGDGGPQQLFDRLYSAAEKLAQAQHVIDQQLKPPTDRAALVEKDRRDLARVRTAIDELSRDTQRDAEAAKTDAVRRAAEAEQTRVASQEAMAAVRAAARQRSVNVRRTEMMDDLVGLWEKSSVDSFRSNQPIVVSLSIARQGDKLRGTWHEHRDKKNGYYSGDFDLDLELDVTTNMNPSDRKLDADPRLDIASTLYISSRVTAGQWLDSSSRRRATLNPLLWISGGTGNSLRVDILYWQDFHTIIELTRRRTVQ